MSKINVPANQFGRNLAICRKERGLSQEMLAERCGLSRNFIVLLERGRQQPSLPTLLQLRKALGISLDELAGPSTEDSGKTSEDPATYKTRPSSRELNLLMRQLGKHSPEEVKVLTGIIRQTMRLKKMK
ncbi:MAG: helix-turn-helix transcriptional regulator [Verrucomicrobiae bacterium]|nr:helix-turn-helix transcriptional regulator [Verrucomicrobiae bacterium]